METIKPHLESLTSALKMERDGRQFFLEARDKTSHPLAKKTFSSLADWELEHIRIIERFHDSLKETGNWESAAQLRASRGEATKAFRTIFQQAREHIDETVGTDADVLEAYRIARGFEDKLVVFYEEKAKETSAENARLFYDFLADQEREHRMILDNSYRYLENPAQWSAEEENWMFDGG